MDRTNAVISVDLFDGLRSIIAYLESLALNSGLWLRRLLIGGRAFQGRCLAKRATMWAAQKNNPPQ